MYWSGSAVRYSWAWGGAGLRSGTVADALQASEWAPAMAGIAAIASSEPIGPISAFAPPSTSSVTALVTVSPTFAPAVSAATGAPSTPPPALMSSIASVRAFCWAKPMSQSRGWLEAMKPKVSSGGVSGSTGTVVGTAPPVVAGAGVTVVVGAELAGAPSSSLEHAATRTTAAVATAASRHLVARAAGVPRRPVHPPNPRPRPGDGPRCQARCWAKKSRTISARWQRCTGDPLRDSSWFSPGKR